MSRILILVFGVAARSVTPAVGRPPTQKKPSIFLSFMRIDALGDAEALLDDVLLVIEAGRLEHANGIDLGGAAGRARGDALALHVLDLVDAGAFHGHGVHVVGVHDHQRRDRQLGWKLVLAVDGVPGRVHLGEANVGLAGADELQVGDRAAGDLGRRRDARNLLAEDVAEAAAERIVDAAGAAGGDRKLLGLLSLSPRRADHKSGAEAQ